MLAILTNSSAFLMADKWAGSLLAKEPDRKKRLCRHLHHHQPPASTSIRLLTLTKYSAIPERKLFFLNKTWDQRRKKRYFGVEGYSIFQTLHRADSTSAGIWMIRPFDPNFCPVDPVDQTNRHQSFSKNIGDLIFDFSNTVTNL